MWKLTIVLFFTILNYNLFAKDKFQEIKGKSKEIIIKSCKELLKGKNKTDKICQCVVKNLNQIKLTKKEHDFMVKYYEKKTKLECGEYSMLCSGNFNIIASCSKDSSYDIDSPDAHHSHGD